MRLSVPMLCALAVLASLHVHADPVEREVADRAVSGSPDAAAAATPWHELVTTPGRDLRLRRVVTDGAGGLWVLFARQAKGRALDSGGLRLMHIDAAGRQGAALPVSLPSGLDYRRGCSSVALALDNGGAPAVLCNTNGGIAVIEPAATAGEEARVRRYRTDAWPFGLQAIGPGSFRVVTNEAVLRWSADSDPEIELAAGPDQVFIASVSVPGGLALLHSTVSPLGPTALKAGRLDPARPSLDGFRPVDDGGQVSTLLTRMAATASTMAVLTPVDKGPQSRWHNAIFDADMNLVHASQVALPFEITLTMPLALHLLPDGRQLLAGQRDGQLWLATIGRDGALVERETPAHLLVPEGATRRLLDLQWAASPDGSRITLAGTAIVYEDEAEGASYGLWFAGIDAAAMN